MWNCSLPAGHCLPAMWLRGHDRQHEPHHSGLDPQRLSQLGGSRRWTLKARREGRTVLDCDDRNKPTKMETCYRRHKNSLMLSFDVLSNRPCHSKRMYPNSVQYALIGHTDGVLFVLSLFIVPLSHFSLNIHCTAEKYFEGASNLRRYSHRIQNAAHAQVRCYKFESLRARQL